MNTLTANSNCAEEFSEVAVVKKNAHSITFTTIAFIAGYIVALIAFGFLSWYGVSSGLYPVINLM